LRATSRKRPSENFMMFALWTAVTFRRPFFFAYRSIADDALRGRNADRLDRDPRVLRDVALRLEVDERAKGRSAVAATLELDPRVEVPVFSRTITRSMLS